METKQVRLPQDLIERTLADLAIGESAWATPWNMLVDNERRCWIDVRATAGEIRFGTACMEVTRREDGFAVKVYDPSSR